MSLYNYFHLEKKKWSRNYFSRGQKGYPMISLITSTVNIIHVMQRTDGRLLAEVSTFWKGGSYQVMQSMDDPTTY